MKTQNPKLEALNKPKTQNSKQKIEKFCVLNLKFLIYLGFRILSLVFISTILYEPCWAALDIFDHPKQAERKKKTVQKQAEMNFLDYPKDCFLKGDYKEAFKSCQKLLDYPSAQKLKGDISYLAGLSLLKLGRFLEARTYFNDIILIGTERKDLKINALLGIGDSYFLEENLSKAYDMYNKILADYSDSEVTCIVYYRLGETLLKMGRGDEAKYYLDKVEKEFPFSFEARLSARLAARPRAKPRARLSGNIAPVTIDREDVYSIQAGCFNDKDNADRLCEKLVREGFSAYILESSDNPRFRVKVGRTRSKEEIEGLESSLKRSGYFTKICP